MMGRTHLLLGFNTLWLFEVLPPLAGLLTDPNRFALCLLTAGLGALLPDLDASSSLLQTLSFGGIRPFVPPAQVLHASLGHRGALHSLLSLGLISLLTLPLWQVDSMAWWSFVMGFASHLASDACTKSGVPLLFPRRQSIRFLPRSLRLSTGSSAEEAVFAVFALGALCLLLRHVFSMRFLAGGLSL